MMLYIKNLINASSGWLNVALFNGNPGESICCRCHRENRKVAVSVLNFIVFWQKNHCRSAYTTEIEAAKAFLASEIKI